MKGWLSFSLEHADDVGDHHPGNFHHRLAGFGLKSGFHVVEILASSHDTSVQ